jgi:hypothetical protein
MINVASGGEFRDVITNGSVSIPASGQVRLPAQTSMVLVPR